MTKHGLEGVSVVWWFMLLFTICRVYVSKWLRRVLFFHFFLVAGIKVEKKEAWNMAKHGLEGVSVVW